jgi:SAM-dependent methyltransferase
MPFCHVCGKNVQFFKGGTGNGQDVCPLCTSRARNRSIARWVAENVEGFHNVLEIGQFHSLTPLYKRRRWAYSLVDIQPPRKGLYVSLVADVCDLPYRDATFGLVIAGHVLEHVIDDVRAYVELLRVVKNDGVLVVQVPFLSPHGKTVEYGEAKQQEENHVRAPGTDYVDRLKKPGVKVEWVKKYHRPLGSCEQFFVIRKDWVEKEEGAT